MTEIRRVPATAGAEWLLGGFRLLARSPTGLGTLGALVGVLSLCAALAAQGGGNSAAMAMQFVFLVLGPLLLAGLVYAAREVDEGRGATPGHLLRGVQEGKAARLLGTLLPQIAALVLCALLLIVLVGPEQLQRMADVLAQIEAQAQPDPALVAQLPVARLMLWLLLVLVIGVVAGFFTFTAVPDMMLGDRGLLDAMRNSIRACLGSLPALLLFFAMLLVVAVALNFALLLAGLAIGALAGPAATAAVMQIGMSAVLMPVVTGAMYLAWKQMVATGGSVAPAPVRHIEV